MNWVIVVAVTLLVLLGGSVIAVAWWNLARKVAPYHDELAQPGSRGGDDKTRRGEEVIVIPTPRAEKR